MAKLKISFWKKYKYLLSGFILILPFYFLYQSLNPIFPDALPEKSLGQFKITPMPFNEDPPYQHDGIYVKNFLLLFNQGNITDIRQAFLNIGEKNLPINVMNKQELGILHGNKHGQHVHALAPQKITNEHSVWLTIEKWDGELLVTSWAMPNYLK